MRGLTILVAGADPARYRAGLRLAAAQGALGAPARLFLDTDAVRLLAAHEPLLGTALDLGVAVIACQTGLADAGLTLADLDPRIEGGGPLALLASLGEDRLLAC